MKYFAYGSNMDKEDLDAWCEKNGFPIVKILNVLPSKLTNYKLSFNYFSTNRNGGAANIMESEKDCVYGLLIEVLEGDLKTIRKKEGYPDYYNEICIDVEQFNGELAHNVITYKVDKSKEKSEHQPPTEYYIGLIIKNAKKYNFPKEYIEFLDSFKNKGGVMKRSAYLKYDEEIELGRRGLTIWAYGPKGKYVCRVQINAAGIAVYTGKKGGKRVADINWEKLVKQLSK